MVRAQGGTPTTVALGRWSIDFYRRHFVTAAADAHYLRVSKLATIGWGLFSCVVAMYAANQGSLIEVVNRYGSFFYGSLLGVFILAILTRRATAAHDSRRVSRSENSCRKISVRPASRRDRSTRWLRLVCC